MQDTKQSEILLDLTFPIPPNTNNAYRRRKQGGMYMTDEGQRFKALVATAIKSAVPDFAIPKKTPLVIYFYFYLASNRLNVNDWDGLIKLLQDAIFETGGGNDAWVRQACVCKYPAKDEEPFSIVHLLTQEANDAS